MNESMEFESLDDFLRVSETGFVILDQFKAQGELNAMQDANRSKLADRFQHFLSELKSRLGTPSEIADEWDIGIPTFASGNGYALWKDDENFISLFVSWDNPEDPAFVIIARAALSSFDVTPGALDPWGAKWMNKGEW